MERLNNRVSKLLAAAVQEVLELVRQTVVEYQDKTARTQRENDRLRHRLQEALECLDNQRQAPGHQLAALPQQQEEEDATPNPNSRMKQDPESNSGRLQDPNAKSSPRTTQTPSTTLRKRRLQESASPPAHWEVLKRSEVQYVEKGGGPQPEEEEGEQKLSTKDLLTECAVRVQVMLPDPISAHSHSHAAPADALNKVGTDIEYIKNDVDTIPIIPVVLATTMTTSSIPSPSNQVTCEIPTILPELIKEEPASPPPPSEHQEVPPRGLVLQQDLSGTSTQGSSSQPSGSTEVAPFSMPFVGQQQPPRTHMQQHVLARRLGFSSGFSGFSRTQRISSDVLRRNGRQGIGGANIGNACREDNSHVCGMCGKTFSRLGNLRIHERCHTGEKPYACAQCGRCFSQAGDLKKHRRVHTGEKPYICGQCGKSFSRGENLRRHQKIHIGKRIHPQQGWGDHRPAYS